MSVRFLAVLTCGFLSMVLGTVRSQTVLDLHVGDGVCLFTSDNAGVSADPNTGHLVATNTGGAPFSGACGSGGGAAPPAIAQPLTAAPAAPTVGQTFVLSWSAQNTDYCQTNGTVMPPGASLSSWPLADVVCAGATCAGASVAATPSVAGSYFFNLQCFKSGNPSPATTSRTVVVSGAGTSCSSRPPVYATRQSPLAVTYGNHGTYDQTTHDGTFNDAPGTPVEPFPQTGNRAVAFKENAGRCRRARAISASRCRRRASVNGRVRTAPTSWRPVRRSPIPETPCAN